jgi:hypothetical protein
MQIVRAIQSIHKDVSHREAQKAMGFIEHTFLLIREQREVRRTELIGAVSALHIPSINAAIFGILQALNDAIVFQSALQWHIASLCAVLPAAETVTSALATDSDRAAAMPARLLAPQPALHQKLMALGTTVSSLRLRIHQCQLLCIAVNDSTHLGPQLSEAVTSCCERALAIVGGLVRSIDAHAADLDRQLRGAHSGTTVLCARHSVEPHVAHAGSRSLGSVETLQQADAVSEALLVDLAKSGALGRI